MAAHQLVALRWRHVLQAWTGALKLILVLGFLACVGGCAGTPALSPAAAAVRISTQAPPANEQPITSLRAVHGEGCGFGGLLGNRDGAVNRMQTLAAEAGADYVQIVGKIEPHVEGDCRRNEYVLDGLAFRSRISSSPDPTPKPPSRKVHSDSLQKARAEDLRLRWVVRLMVLGGEAIRQHDNDPKLVLPPEAPNVSNNFTMGVGGADLLRTTALIGDTLYLGYGVSAGAAYTGTNQCSEPLVCNDTKCVCDGTMAKWTGQGVAYGPELGLMLKRGAFPFLTFWLPTLRAYHVITFSSPKDEACRAAHGSCGELSARNLFVSAMLELDWPFHDLSWTGSKLFTGGCGLGFGALALFGDLADQQNTRWMYGARIGANFDWLFPQ